MSALIADAALLEETDAQQATRRERWAQDEKRQAWFDEAGMSLYDVIRYAEIGRLQADVRDLVGLRRALEQLIVRVKLTTAAIKKVEEINRATAGKDKPP